MSEYTVYWNKDIHVIGVSMNIMDHNDFFVLSNSSKCSDANIGGEI